MYYKLFVFAKSNNIIFSKIVFMSHLSVKVSYAIKYNFIRKSKITWLVWLIPWEQLIESSKINKTDLSYFANINFF